MRKLVFLFALLCSACVGPRFIIKQNQPNYPIDVFWNGDEPSRPFVVIEEVLVENEEDMTKADQPVRGRVRTRGNNMEAKDLLTAQLVLKAKGVGADAISQVKYSYFTSAQTKGYRMSGKAVRYTGE